MTSEVKLRTIYSYLKDNVRWINLFEPLEELWDLEDVVVRGQEGLVRSLFSHDHTFHQLVMEDLFPGTESRKAHCNNMELQHIHENISGCSSVCYDEFTRHVDICLPSMSVGSNWKVKQKSSCH
jgi:hypothetical protein